MAVIREKEETLEQRVIRALAGFSLRRVMGCRWRAEIVAPAIREVSVELMRLSPRTGMPQFVG